jgi:hypothetical protein
VRERSDEPGNAGIARQLAARLRISAVMAGTIWCRSPITA